MADDDKVKKAAAESAAKTKEKAAKASAKAAADLAKKKAKDQKAKTRAEKKHLKMMETDAKYAHDFQVASTKKWRETRINNAAAEQDILDQKAVNERKYGDVQEKNLHDATKARQKNEEDFATSIAEGRAERSKSGQLADQFKKEKETASTGADQVKTEDKLKGMNSFLGSTEQSKALLEEFKSVRLKLDNPDITPLEREVLNKELDQISAGADAEEERREKQAEIDKNTGSLNRIAKGVEATASGFDKFRDGMMKGGGIIAALGAIALLFFDPETLMKGISDSLEVIKDIISGIGKILTGDWEGGMEDLEGHFGKVALGIGVVAVYFGGAIMRGVASMITSASSLSAFMGKGAKAIKALGLGLKAAALASTTAMGSMLMGMLTFLAPFAIPIAIAAAIALVVAGIGFALTKLRDALGFTSVFDVVMLGVAYLKDAFARMGNLVIDIYNKIIGLVSGFASWLGFDMPDLTLDRLNTDNAVKKQAELEEKARVEGAKKAQEQKEKEMNESQNDLKIAGMGKMIDGVPSGVNIGPMSDDEMNQLELMNITAGAPSEAEYMKSLGLNPEIAAESKSLGFAAAAESKKQRNAEILLKQEADLKSKQEERLLREGGAAFPGIINTNNSGGNDMSTQIINNIGTNSGVSRVLNGRRKTGPSGR